MTDIARLQVEVRSDGVAKTKKEVEDLGKSMQAAQAGADMLRGVMAGMGTLGVAGIFAALGSELVGVISHFRELEEKSKQAAAEIWGHQEEAIQKVIDKIREFNGEQVLDDKERTAIARVQYDWAKAQDAVVKYYKEVQAAQQNLDAVRAKRDRLGEGNQAEAGAQKWLDEAQGRLAVAKAAREQVMADENLIKAQNLERKNAEDLATAMREGTALMKREREARDHRAQALHREAEAFIRQQNAVSLSRAAQAQLTIEVFKGTEADRQAMAVAAKAATVREIEARIRVGDIKFREQEAQVMERQTRVAQRAIEVAEQEAWLMLRTRAAADPLRASMGDVADEVDRLQKLMASGDLSQHKFERRILDLNLAMAKLRIQMESGSVWDMMAVAITDSTSRGTDALVDFMNRTNDTARTWENLGLTVRNVVADILRQVQRMMLQQSVVSPLFRYAASLLLPAAGPAPATTYQNAGNLVGSVPVGMSMAAPAKGLDSGSVAVTVNINANGSTDAKAAGKGGEDLGRQVRALCNAWAIEQKRSGGLLAVGA